MIADRKRASELAAFARFAAAANIRFVAGSIEQPEPPAPDLVVEIQGIGRVAFELVRLDADEEFLSRRYFLQAQEFIQAEFNRLSDLRRSAIATKFRSSEITIEFRRFADLPARRLALERAWSVLASVPVDHDGQVNLRGREIPDVDSLWVIPARERTALYFRSFIVGSPLPINAERLTEKLKARYVCTDPLELLAYNEVEQLAHLADEKRIRDAVESQIAGSQFRRVWVFDTLLNRVEYRFDASQTEHQI